MLHLRYGEQTNVPPCRSAGQWSPTVHIKYLMPLIIKSCQNNNGIVSQWRLLLVIHSTEIIITGGIRCGDMFCHKDGLRCCHAGVKQSLTHNKVCHVHTPHLQSLTLVYNIIHIYMHVNFDIHMHMQRTDK